MKVCAEVPVTRQTAVREIVTAERGAISVDKLEAVRRIWDFSRRSLAAICMQLEPHPRNLDE